MNGVAGFFQEYFISPITSHSGYNPINTFAYALIAIVLCFFVIYPFLNKRKIKFDINFALAVLPYVILGSTVRIFEESYSSVFLISRSASPLEFGYYFISPGIYVMIGLLTIFSLVISLKIGRKKKCNPLNVFRNVGIILSAPVVSYHMFHFTHIEAFLGILMTTAAVSGVVFLVYRKAKNKLFNDKLNRLTLIGQALDGSATAIILQFYPVYFEQHFLSSAIIQTFGPFAFLLVKVMVAIVVLYFIDYMLATKGVTKNFAGFVKILIIILGFATGTRDMFSVSMTTAI
ncbi:MAG: DUF63 family protein [Candidatus Aenigmarchaeota archaeon]|nr:DUF63 family protein [Candidatus Aenigmarchaeota archaeon]